MVVLVRIGTRIPLLFIPVYYNYNIIFWQGILDSGIGIAQLFDGQIDIKCPPLLGGHYLLHQSPRVIHHSILRRLLAASSSTLRAWSLTLTQLSWVAAFTIPNCTERPCFVCSRLLILALTFSVCL